MHSDQDYNRVQRDGIPGMRKLLLIGVVLFIGIISLPFISCHNVRTGEAGKMSGEGPAVDVAKKSEPIYWKASDISAIKDLEQKEQIVYGKGLIEHTSSYLGPKGSVLKMSNGLNCQNCHLQAGTAPFGNNYGSVASLYPKFRERSGAIENVYKRVNDCFERSLNGKELDTTSKEMQAIVSYINFIGSGVAKGTKAAGSGLKDIAWLDRAADPEMGKTVYDVKCQSCHQLNGEGVFNADKTEYIFPPLWGKNSFNDGAGLYRISNFAKYVKYNMPQGTTHENPQLTDEEAWDVSAYILSQKRPHMNAPKDWPDKSKKPADHPFGPYADNFSQKQHKYGPFKIMLEEQKRMDEAPKRKATAAAKK